MKKLRKNNRYLSILIILLLLLSVVPSLPTWADQQILKRIRITETKITRIENKTYTGKKQTQKPVIMYGGYRLKLNIDYILSYKDNTKVGTASVIIKGKGKYTGKVTKEFLISPVSTDSSVSDQIGSGEPNEDESSTMNITIGDTIFTATLENSDTVKTLVDQLPLTVNMSELNGNEKYYFLSKKLRADSASFTETITKGDLMLYGDNCLVLFYKTFNTSYSYVKLGHIDTIDGLEKAIGSGDIQITFSLNK